jgi:nucleotide-binding universal stress UspA family protein
MALSFAEKIRGKSEGKIHVVHVSDLPLEWDLNPDLGTFLTMDERLKSFIVQDIEKKLIKQITDLKIECTHEIVTGFPFSFIHEISKKINADILVLGNKGIKNTPLPLGGIAEKMVATSQIPVLIVKKEEPLIKITGLVDPHYFYQKIINATEEFASLFSSQVEILTLWPEPDTMSKVREIIASHLTSQLEGEVKVVPLTEKKVAYRLNEILTEDYTDMVVMQRHHKSLLSKMIIGSETRRMLELFHGNILVLPD